MLNFVQLILADVSRLIVIRNSVLELNGETVECGWPVADRSIPLRASRPTPCLPSAFENKMKVILILLLLSGIWTMLEGIKLKSNAVALSSDFKSFEEHKQVMSFSLKCTNIISP